MSTANRPTESVRELFARELSVVIQADPATIFAYVADISRHPEWAANPLEIHHIAGPTSGPGATFASVAHRTARVAGTFTGQVRVLTAEPPTRLIYEVKDTSGHYRWSFVLQPEGQGTRVTQRMAKLGGPWIINVLQPPMIWPLVGSYQGRVGLANLKARIEGAR